MSIGERQLQKYKFRERERDWQRKTEVRWKVEKIMSTLDDTSTGN